MKKKQICVVTGTRAEYGLLRPLLFRLRDNEEVELKMMVTGTHLSEAFGNTQEEIRADGFCDYVAVQIPLEKDSKKAMAQTTGVALEKFAEVLEAIKPDILVVLGDRYEILAATIAAHFLGIPIAHLCGGDVTEGAVDDAIRHCITKMSTLHFPGCEQAAKRIIQMGEHPSRVFNVGEPGIENCLHAELMSREELAENLHFSPIRSDYAVVTFHPVTMEKDTAKDQLQELIAAMEQHDELAYIITLANADAGGRIINDMWREAGEQHGNWFVTTSLGMRRYLSAVKYAKMVIGNSSSGIIEVPAMRVPTINIGDRQKGRMMAKSVLCAKPEAAAIADAIAKAQTFEFRQSIKDMELPFGDGTTSEKMERILMNYLEKNVRSTQKHFYDIR